MTFAKKIKKLCRTSLFISLLMALINAIYNCLRDGLFGRLLTSYSAEERLLRKGVIGQFFSKKGKAAKWLRQLRLRLADFFEKSYLLDVGLRKASYLLGCSLRVYGIFMLTFGAYTVLIHFIKHYAFANLTQTNTALYIGIVSIALGLPMIGSRHSVAELLQKGLLPHLFLVDVFGIPEERFDIPRVKGGGRYNYALIMGMLLGILTFLIPAQYLILLLFCVIVIAIVMSYPEVGVLAIIAFLPFLAWIKKPFQMMDFAIGLTALAYLGKLIRGKRIIRFSLIDTLVLLVGVMLWLGGVSSVGGEASLHRVSHICLLLLMYFMIVNLIRTPAWLHRAVLAVLGSATLLAVVGIFQYISEKNGSASTDSQMFSSVLVRVSTTFETSSMFAAYLVLLMPLCAAVFVTVSGGKHRLIAAGCGIAMFCALIFTWSQSAWFGVLSALLFFFLIYSRKTACWLLLGGLTVPVWCWLLPDNLTNRLFRIFNMTDSAIYKQVYTWRGTVRMLTDNLLGGIGYGTEAFQEIYPRYSFSGLEQAENAGSFYLALLSAVGIFGLLVFLIMIVVFAQHCFEYIGNASEAYSRTFVAAGLSSIVGALVMGIGCDIWHDETVLLTFFTVLALTCAYIRAGVLIRTRNQDVSGTDVSHAHIDLHFEL